MRRAVRFVGRSRRTERGSDDAPRERRVEFDDGSIDYVEEGSIYWTQAEEAAA